MKAKKLLPLFMEEDHSKEEIQIVPMIDVMLFLLVFFMVYTLNVVPMLVQDIRLPSSTTVERKDVEESIKVYVKKDGTVVLENRELGLDALRSYLKGIRDKEKASVLIIADKDAQVQRVIDVIDVLKEEGISKVGLSGERK